MQLLMNWHLKVKSLSSVLDNFTLNIFWCTSPFESRYSCVLEVSKYPWRTLNVDSFLWQHLTVSLIPVSCKICWMSTSIMRNLLAEYQTIVSLVYLSIFDSIDEVLYFNIFCNVQLVCHSSSSLSLKLSFISCFQICELHRQDLLT